MPVIPPAKRAKTIKWGQSTIWDSDIPKVIASGDPPPPFNGVTAYLSLLSLGQSTDVSLHERVWDSTKTFSDAEVQASWPLVKRLSELGYTDNFVELSPGFVSPGPWWDGSPSSVLAFSVVKDHVRQGAHIAGAGGCRGIFCNMEAFASLPLCKIPETLTSLSDYLHFRNYIMQLGREYVQAMEQGFGAGVHAGGGDQGDFLWIVLDRAILSLYEDMKPYNSDDTTQDFRNWANNGELVWLSFLNGMIDGASPHTTFIDACEGESYGVYGSTGQRKYDSFADIRELWQDDTNYKDGIFVAKQKYEQQCKLGFIFWFLGDPCEKSDGHSCHDPRNAVAVDPGHPPPHGDGDYGKLEMLATDALNNSDGYMFIYNQEDYAFFPGLPGPQHNNVPPKYIDVLTNLKFRSTPMGVFLTGHGLVDCGVTSNEKLLAAVTITGVENAPGKSGNIYLGDLPGIGYVRVDSIDQQQLALILQAIALKWKSTIRVDHLALAPAETNAWAGNLSYLQVTPS